MVNNKNIRLKYSIIRFAPLILEENDYDNFFVANFYRPLTANAADAFEVMKEIEAAGKVPFTGIVNNSNLGDETTAQDVLKKIPLAEELAEMSGLPVVMTSAKRNIADNLGIENVLALDLQAKYY